MQTILILLLLLVLLGGGGYSWRTYNVNPQNGGLLGVLVVICVVVLVVGIIRGGPPAV